MKKFIKSIPVYLTVVMLLCCLLVVPAFATSDNDPLVFEKHENCLFNLSGSEISADGFYFYVFALPIGEYILEFDFDLSYMDGVMGDVVDNVAGVSLFDFEAGNYSTIDFVNPGVAFAVTKDMVVSGLTDEYSVFNGKCLIGVNSFGVEPVVTVYEPPKATGIYYQAFDMIAGFIYGEGAELTAEQNMVLTTLATTLALSVFVVPFLLIIWFIRMFR